MRRHPVGERAMKERTLVIFSWFLRCPRKKLGHIAFPGIFTCICPIKFHLCALVLMLNIRKHFVEIVIFIIVAEQWNGYLTYFLEHFT